VTVASRGRSSVHRYEQQLLIMVLRTIIITRPVFRGGSYGGLNPPPRKVSTTIFVFHVDVYFRSAGVSVLSSLMTMTVDLVDAILAGFSVEMILIAQTVFFMLIFVTVYLC